MAIGDVIARLAVNLSLETAAFEKGATLAEKRMAQSQKRFEALGSRFGDIGKKMSLALTVPLTAFGVASVKAALESRDAMGQVEASLKSMGGAAGRTGDQLAGLATGIMRKSLYDDDEVLRKVTANLLTFGAVQGDVFDRAQQVIVDYAAKSGKGLQEVTIMVGKALQDPAKGLSALSKVGVQFDDAQKKQIKSMLAVNNVAGAQAIILGELSRQSAGSAQAALDAAGPMAQLKHQFDDLSETVGGVLLVALDRITPYITKIADAFLNLSPGTQTFIVAAAGLAAALGPIAIGIGAIINLAAPLLAGFSGIAAAIAAVEGVTFAGTVAGWAAALGSLAASALAVAAPIAAVAAAGYLIYQNWDKIAPVLQEFWQTVKSTLGPPLQELVSAIGGALSELWNGPLGGMIREVGSRLLDFQIAYSKVMGPVLLGAIKLAIDTFANLFRSIGDGVRVINALLNGDFAAAFNGIGAIINRALSGIPAKMLEIGRDIVGGLVRGIRDNAEAVWNALKGVVTGGIERAKNLLGIHSPSLVFKEIGDYIGEGLALGIEGKAGRVAAATKNMTDAARRAAEETQALFARLFPEIDKANKYRDDLARIDTSGRSDDAKSEARRRLGLESYGIDPASQNPIAALDTGPLVDAMDNVLDKMDGFGRKAGAVTVAVAKSFKDMADATIQSLGNLANAVKGGGFLDILSAVIGLGLQLGSIGAFGKTIAGRINAPKVPGNANGTSNWRGGLSWVGERGPELVNLPRGSQVFNNRDSMGMMGGKLQVEVVANNNGFGAIVRNHAGQVVAEAAPALIDGGGRAGVAKMGYQQRRRVA